MLAKKKTLALPKCLCRRGGGVPEDKYFLLFPNQQSENAKDDQRNKVWLRKLTLNVALFKNNHFNATIILWC